MKFHFVYPNGEHYQGTRVAEGEEWPLYYGAPAAWILQGYFRLRDHLPGESTIGSLPRQDAMNITTACTLRRLVRTTRLEPCFIVNCLTDKPDYTGEAVRIVQNRNQVGSPRDIWMPLWPQPGLVPRERPAGRRLVLGFFGRPRYGLGNLRGAGLGRRIEALGYDYREIPAERWHDYSDVDVAVGIRAFRNHRYDHKPPSKLVNAWHAGVPFIGGEDSAYSQIGEPGHDFLRVTGPEGLLASLELLRDPDTYRRLVDAGRVRAEAFSLERQTARWVEALGTRANHWYTQWQAAGSPAWRRRRHWQIRLQVIGTRLGRRFGWF